MMNDLTVGKTPLLPLKFGEKTVWGKAEFMNPSGSVKDRPIQNILKQAAKNGLLKVGGTVVEATSGNAGISFAMFCAQKGYKCVIVMPSNMSTERKKMLRMYGAELIEVEAGDFDGAIALRNQLAEENGWFNGNQFGSEWNLEAHRETTAVELLYQCEYNCFYPSALVAGTGTGGTLMGAGLALKDYFPDMKLVAVEPEESAVMSGGSPGLHGIQGIGDGSKFLIELSEIDKIITVHTEEAKKMAWELATEKGIFVGISAGANVLASLRYMTETGQDNVLTILCDRGDRYLSCFN
jgi:cysteine synthase A